MYPLRSHRFLGCQGDCREHQALQPEQPGVKHLSAPAPKGGGARNLQVIPRPHEFFFFFFLIVVN